MTRPQTLLTQLLLALTLAAALVGGTRAAAPWYQVELFVFSQNHQSLAAEFWDHNAIPTHRNNALYLPQAGVTVNDGSAYPILPAKRKLAISKSLMKRNGYKPLFHRAWKQPIYRKGKARPIRITGGNRLNDTRYELEGDISVDIARYLHLHTNLFYTLRVGNGWKSPYSPQQSADSAIPHAPEEPTAITENPDIEAQPSLAPLKDPSLLSVKMEQGRRMRGSETHYLDHPMFGLFIRLTRIAPPALGSTEEPPSSNLKATAEKTQTTNNTAQLYATQSAIQ
ncbi:CsiV family protein [Motiliproteus sp. MSK22-1]|uniref:CsiV family protein n=1 Tax=Motiliproteus sp. MSK22-1 TaxID=1897630 RepID=UPI00097626A6|nr:CsiV family protein [Motiliproteus sp. MSK22-1]OMH33710.1 hypothetical protein BGP75_11945 [Motiliproteus sp. MSK22-1]